jgi:RNA polymerase sigma factor (sigma-70 family)
VPNLPHALIQCLRRQLASTEPDGALLRAFVAGDQDAFRILVSRHGPLVLGVCRRVLGDDHAAEDAFQATFLALSRRAGSIRINGTLSSWSFGVARRTALKARTANRRQSNHETRAATRPKHSTTPVDNLTARELLAALDEELAKLPRAHQEPLLMCYWQGLTRDQMARRMGRSAGVVHGRLERGRRRLADRLRRPGFGPEALPLVPIVGGAVPTDLLARNAGLVATPWSATIPSTVLALAATPSKIVPTIAFSTFLAGAGVLALSAGAGPKADAPKTAAPPSTAVAPLVDHFGEPLPPGAIARLGSLAFCRGDNVQQILTSTDGRSIVSITCGPFEFGTPRGGGK